MVTRAWAVLALLLAVLLAACSNEPVTKPQPVEPTKPAEPTKVVVGVGEFPPGFNPHLVQDQSPITTALTTLVLPSAFRIDAGGIPQLDPTITKSAKVTSESPFTVSYELNLEASWSDNAPIAAEDFVYLWQQMRAQPGAIDAAGYRLVTDVRSRAGGKAVDVVFSHPYPAWQRLFSGLLPAHLVKDAPGSWIGATAGGLPSSGGPFKVNTVDRGRGEIVLTRNDAYWDTPTVLDQLVLRRLGPTGLTAGLTAGDVQMSLSEADSQVRDALAGITPAPRVQAAPQPSVLQLALRTDGGPLRDVQARNAIAAIVDREAIRRDVAPEALAADALGRGPSEPGYTATAPATVRPDPAAAAALFTAAGWRRDLVTGKWDTPDGKPARLVIGAAAERPLDQRVANAVAAQLRAADVDTLVIVPGGDALFGQVTVPPTTPTPTPGPTPTPSATPSPTAVPTTGANGSAVAVDLTVVPRAVGGDLGTELASDYGCATTPTTSAAAAADAARPAGGFCLPALTSSFDRLLTPDPPATAATDLERTLWQQMPALPLFQPVTLVVSTPAADTATSVGPGPLVSGPLTGAERWRVPAK